MKMLCLLCSNYNVTETLPNFELLFDLGGRGCQGGILVSLRLLYHWVDVWLYVRRCTRTCMHCVQQDWCTCCCTPCAIIKLHLVLIQQYS